MTTRKQTAAKAVTPAKAAPAKKAPIKKASSPAKPDARTAVITAAKTQPSATQKQDVKKPKKNHKEKVVRDSFTMPQDEYQKIAEIKKTCLKAGLHVKKSEVLRAGLKALGEMNATQLKQSLSGVEKIRTGRPKKHKG